MFESPGKHLAIDVDHYYRRFGPMVLRRCRRLLSDEQLAVDAMQDTFVLLLRNDRRLRNEAPSSLLYRMATNVCLNVIRGQQRRSEDPAADLLWRIATAESAEPRLMARLRLGRLLAGEKESTAAIAVLHLLDGLTLEEVAAEVGLSVSGVRKRLRRLREHLVELEQDSEGMKETVRRSTR